MGGPVSAGPHSLAQYEFGPAENIVISDCAGRAKVWGVLCLLAGAIQIIASGLNIAGMLPGNGAIFSLPAGVFNLVLGAYFVRAGGSMKTVVDTQGHDITHLMEALRNLSRAFFVQIIATAVFILLVLGIVAVMIRGMTQGH
jgi:hypothetical protein